MLCAFKYIERFQGPTEAEPTVVGDQGAMDEFVYTMYLVPGKSKDKKQRPGRIVRDTHAHR